MTTYKFWALYVFLGSKKQTLQQGKTSEMSQSTSNAMTWQIYGGVTVAGIRFLSSMVLARFLTPSDFGIYGLAILCFTLVSAIGSAGFSSALIRKDNCTETDLSTCFWLTFCTRFVMFLILLGFAYPISLFFNEPAVLPILFLISIIFLISVFEVIPNTLLSKSLNYKVINLIQVFAIVIESIFIIWLVVYMEYDYWALAYGMILNTIIVAVCFYFSVDWKPRLKFSRESYNEQARFGWNTLGFSIMNYFSTNLDYIVVSKSLGTYFLGIYEFAFRIPFLLYQRLVQPVGLVVYPSMAKVKSNKNAVFKMYIDTIYYLSLFMFPALTGMIILGDVMVLTLWGSQWMEAIVPLQILAFCTMLRVWPQAIGAIFMVEGRPDLPFKISIVTLILTLIFVGTFAMKWGLVGVAWGMVLALMPSYYAIFRGLKMINKSFKDILVNLHPVIVSTFCMGGIVYGVKTICKQFLEPRYIIGGRFSWRSGIPNYFHFLFSRTWRQIIRYYIY